MLFSYKWLKEFVQTDLDADEVARRLTLAGIEVDGVEDVTPEITGVVTAEILAIEKHPNADRLALCKVRTAEGTYSIVCGATNMSEGDKVALALPGARLPAGIKLKKTKIRGVASEGMMCSEAELGLAAESEGIMILPRNTPVGEDIRTVLGLEDSLIEADILPNRPDCMSIRGLAREIGAVTCALFRDKEVDFEEGAVAVDDKVKVSVEDTELCRRYTARVIEGIRVEPSPPWLIRRLELHGIRPVNNVVDATNYVLLEYGQPLHAFDLDRIAGGRLVVRKAVKGESVTTIDGRERPLQEGMLVVSDEKGPQAVAGIMGGKDSEVSDSTRSILLESAWFEPSSVRRTSRSLGLSSDSSYRFERGVDIESVSTALDRVTAIILELAGGTVARGMVDIYPTSYRPEPIGFRVERAEALLGVELADGEAENILERLGIRIQKTSITGHVKASPPCYRLDLKREVDLIEEVARLKGYDTIPETMPRAPIGAKEPGRLFELKKKVREGLVACSLMEVVNYSFVARDTVALSGVREERPVHILNPLTEEQSVMRTSLVPSLLENLKSNLSRKNEEVRIFECRPAFCMGEGGKTEERWKAAMLLYGYRWGVRWNQPREWLDFYDMKGVVERLFESLGIEDGVAYRRVVGENRLLHPGKGAVVLVDGREVGVLGELRPDIQERFQFPRPPYVCEMDLEALEEAVPEVRRYEPVPRFPESSRDIAFIVDEEIPFADIMDSILKLDTKLIENVELFDVYYGGNIPAGKRSLALRIIYRSAERTLTYQEVEDIHSRVAAELVGRLNVKIRM